MKRLMPVIAAGLVLLGLPACSSNDSNNAAPSSSSGSAFLDHVKQQGQMTVAVAPSPPNIIQDTTNNTWTGIYPDLMTWLGEQLGVKVSFIGTDFGSMVEGVQSGRYDLAVDLGVTPQRQQAVNFTEPVRTDIGVFYIDKTKNTATSFDELNQAGQTICTGTGTAYDAALKGIDVKATVILLGGLNECLAAMASGRATTVYWGWSTAGTYAPEHPNTGFIFTEDQLVNTPIANAYSKSYSDADMQQINDLIKKWKSDPNGFAAAMKKANAAGQDPLPFAVGTVPDYVKDAAAANFGE